MRFKIILAVLAAIALLSGSLAAMLSIRDTQMIWLATRALGLLAYLFLFLTVLIGEIRMLSEVKADFLLFRFHKPIAIAAITLVLLHGASAIIDSFKWGKSLVWQDYLGFSFGDKWLFFLSFGTLAAYMLLIVGMTSIKRLTQTIGFRRWKLIHYLSYPAFIMAHVHSINLGTDLKSSSFAAILIPVFLVAFLLVFALLAARVLRGFGLLKDQWDISLASIFFILLFVSSAFFARSMIAKEERLDAMGLKIDAMGTDISMYEEQILNLSLENLELESRIEAIKDG